MAFVSFDSAESIAIGTNGFADDGAGSNEANLVDGNTGTSSSAEIRSGMACYKAIIDLGFPVANLDNSNLSIRIFDGTIMTAAGLCILHPYIDGNSVHASVSSVAAINDNAAYDEFLMPSAWVDELVDVGTDQIAVRFFAGGAGRGRFNELQIEFFEAAGGDIAATPDLAFTVPDADLEGGGKLDATPDMVFTIASADLKAKGKLDASPALVIALPVADLKALGKLDAPPPLVFGVPIADLKALGKLDATPDLAFATASASLIDAAGGLISAPPAMVFSATADLKGKGKLDSTPDLTFSVPAADLEGGGKLDASPAVVFSVPAADLGGLGKLDAQPALAFAVPSANLIDATPPQAEFPYHIFKQNRRDMSALITL